MSLQGDPDGERLGQLLGQWIELRLVHGMEADPEELCRDEPAQLGPLRECIREYEQLDRMLAPAQGLAGRKLGHYRILTKLGEGGMGQVYSATDTTLGRRVAVKVLPLEMAADRERLERFRREARAVAALNHPNVVTLFSVEEADGIHFLTMELVEGKTLDALIRPGGLDHARFLDFAGQLVDALVAAHERGIVHRDLKPANVMVRPDGRLKVLDFGLAKPRPPPGGRDGSDSARTLTMEGKLVGTVPYMSPEQVLGRAVDPRTDLFSLGVVLYEMATGRRPFRGESNVELISSILHDTPAPLTELPPVLARLVLRCLEKESGQRFQSAPELRAELHRLEQEMGTRELGSAGFPKKGSTTGLPARMPVRWLTWSAAGVLVALAVLLALWWASRDSGEAAVRSAPPAADTEPPEGVLPEAWRLYSEAVDLSYQSKRMEAIALLEKAVEIDPDFALALAYLGNVHKDLGHEAAAREYKTRAFELAERLPLDQQIRIEGMYYTTWSTYGRSIEIYRRGLRMDPGQAGWRGKLAYRYAYLERYEEAAEELEKLFVDAPAYQGNYTLAADVYAALGRFETGYRLLADFLRQHPDSWSAECKLGWLLIEWGRFEEAEDHLEKAQRLRPFDYTIPYGRWRLRVRLEDWEGADGEAARMAEATDPQGRWRSAISRARNLTYRGRTNEALGRFDEAIRAIPERSAFTAMARCWKAELLLKRGDAARALEEALLAQEEGRDEFPELRGLFLAAMAEQQLGRPRNADASEAVLREKWESLPNQVEERQLLHLAGLLALARGDAEIASRALVEAESLLPPRGIEIAWHLYPQHVPIWFALGQAELAAGRPSKALPWFERVVASSEYVEQPVPYVRSFYFLGHLRSRSGETEKSRRHFERFLRYWQDGDIDRERVEEALAATR